MAQETLNVAIGEKKSREWGPTDWDRITICADWLFDVEKRKAHLMSTDGRVLDSRPMQPREIDRELQRMYS